MPNTSSAKKALRQNAKRRLLNRSQRSSLRSVLKRVQTAIEAADQQGAHNAFRDAVKRLDQAAGKHLIHKNTAARTKSRLSRQLQTKFAAGE